jgi:hypothetical protein
MAKMNLLRALAFLGLGLATPLNNTYIQERQPLVGYYVQVESLDEKIERSFTRIRPRLQPVETQEVLDTIQYRYKTGNSDDENLKAELLTDLRLIESYPAPIPVPRHDIRNFKNNLKQVTNVQTAQVLYNTPIWKELFWSDWDAVPSEVLEVSLNRQFEQYRQVLNGENWPEMSPKEWGDVPGPVRTAAFMTMIKQASGKYGLEELVGRGDAHKWYASIVISESFFEQNAVNKKDVGLAQLSPYAQKKISKMAEFRNYTKRDFKIPYNSIMAGAAWFRLNLEDFRGAGSKEERLRLAIGAYNAGFEAAVKGTKRAVSYEELVKNRYERYMQGSHENSHTWKKIFEIVEGGF